MTDRQKLYHVQFEFTDDRKNPRRVASFDSLEKAQDFRQKLISYDDRFKGIFIFVTTLCKDTQDALDLFYIY